MALPSTIHKLTLNISDMDRGYYAEHILTLARHPSETEERLMVRVFAFALWASERLEAGRGLSCVEDPDWQDRDLTGRITRWVDVGLVDLKRAKRALAQADVVSVLTYGDRATDVWWQKESAGFHALRAGDRLSIWRLDADDTSTLAALCARAMTVQLMVQDGEYNFASDAGMVTLRPRRLLPAD